MSFINNLRNIIADAIAPNRTIKAPAGVKSITIPQAPKHVLTQAERQHEQPAKIPGKVRVSQIVDLSSDYLKHALLQYGAWIALAKAFSEYERIAGKRGVSDQKMASFIEEFHSFNSACDASKQMDEESVIITVDRLANVPPQKGSKETDAIIARVRKCSVEELKAQRIKQAEQASARRAELLEGFIAQVWSFTGTDVDPAIDGPKAATKALQTMDYIATQWTGNPASIAGELLLVEADIAKLERIAREDSDAGTDQRFINGTLTADGMMNQEEVERRIGDVRPDITPKARQMVRRIRRAEIERDMQAHQEADHVDDEELDTDAERAA